MNALQDGQGQGDVQRIAQAGSELCGTLLKKLGVQVCGAAASGPVSMGLPATPGMALSTPAMSAPAAVAPAASTALSATAPLAGIQLDASQIAEKWGHADGLARYSGANEVLQQTLTPSQQPSLEALQILWNTERQLSSALRTGLGSVLNLHNDCR